jgi:hypothetical protein
VLQKLVTCVGTNLGRDACAVTAPTAGSKSALTPCAFTAALHGVVEIERTRSRSDRQDGHVLIRLQVKIETDSVARSPTAPSGLQIENSNPKPCRYERATFTETSNDYWHFRAGSLTNVRVWLRRSIGYLLVGLEASLWPPPRAPMRSLRFSGRAFGPAGHSDRAECDGNPPVAIS